MITHTVRLVTTATFYTLLHLRSLRTPRFTLFYGATTRSPRLRRSTAFYTRAVYLYRTLRFCITATLHHGWLVHVHTYTLVTHTTRSFVRLVGLPLLPRLPSVRLYRLRCGYYLCRWIWFTFYVLYTFIYWFFLLPHTVGFARLHCVTALRSLRSCLHTRCCICLPRLFAVPGYLRCRFTILPRLPFTFTVCAFIHFTFCVCAIITDVVLFCRCCRSRSLF